MWILLEQETTMWQWYQLDHVQIICSSIQTDNNASISSLIFTGQMTLIQHCRSCGVLIIFMHRKYTIGSKQIEEEITARGSGGVL